MAKIVETKIGIRREIMTGGGEMGGRVGDSVDLKGGQATVKMKMKMKS